MINVNGTTIEMTRGDTLSIKIVIRDKITQEEYVPIEGDRVVFTVKANYKDEEPLIQKDVPIDTLILDIFPDDTKPLKMPNTYVYDVQLITSDGQVDTFISKAKLKIKEEVG